MIRGIPSLILLYVSSSLVLHKSIAFTPIAKHHHIISQPTLHPKNIPKPTIRSKTNNELRAIINQDDTNESSNNIQVNRRVMFRKLMGSTTAFCTTALIGDIMANNSNNRAAWAAEKSSEPIIWKSGKPPIIPGQKPKDKNDTSGTRKDPNFLRSIATCKVRFNHEINNNHITSN